jgi:filamentous hemagglutinin family protein
LKPCTLVAASISLLFAHASLWANPTGPQVVNGQVNFQQPNASVLNVANSPGSIINWQGFSIGAGEVTRFIQQSATSSVLNRVTGGNVSQIYGQLLSNGRVFLINPGGIVVGPGAIVDTAGFVASTLNMLDSDFLAGKLKFQGDATSGSIVNQGWIRTGYGGQVVLVAPSIENSGLIHTPGGELILAAGQKMTVATLDLGGVQFELQAPTDSVLNVGKLIADGGAVGVFAGTLRHTGEIRANSLVYDEAGRVVLKAQNEIQLAAGSATSADGRIGGSITVQGGGPTRVAGAISATGSTGSGGSIQLLGSSVAVTDNAAVDASGATRGGQILVGGDYQGANAAIQNSSNTFVGSGTSLRADATQSGDGGRIIVWSDDKAQFYGSLSAQGGPNGGNGGFAEVSGKQGLVFEGAANLGAPRGALGDLLLDPLDLYVFAGGGINSTIINSATAVPADFPSNAATVSPATLAAITGNVTLQAARYMRITDPITLTTAGQGLTATVGAYTVPAAPDPLSMSTAVSNRLDLGAGITTSSGAVTLNAPTIQNVAASPITIATNGGAISLNATNQISGTNLALNASSGAVSATNTVGSIGLGAVTGGTFTATAPGSITTASITTTGNVTETSTSGSINTGTVTAGGGIVALSGGSIFSTVNTTGPVTLTSTSSTISATVNGSSSLTATGASSVFISSTTDVNVANVTAGTNASAQINTTGGSILATGASPLVKGLDVSLLTAAGTGGGIGTASTALNVDVQRSFTFRPNGNFNILLTGTGPNQLNAQLTPANSGTYSGTLSKQSGGLTLNASADTSTVTLSSLNITSGFDQTVFFGSPSISIQTTNGANLVATSVNVPTGDTVSTLSNPNGLPLSVVLTSAGNLTLTSYTRAAGGLAKTTTLNASGTVTLGTVDASKDTVSVSGPSGITVGSLISTGPTSNITLNSSLGPVNAANDTVALDILLGRNADDQRARHRDERVPQPA